MSNATAATSFDAYPELIVAAYWELKLDATDGIYSDVTPEWDGALFEEATTLLWKKGWNLSCDAVRRAMAHLLREEYVEDARLGR